MVDIARVMSGNQLDDPREQEAGRLSCRSFFAMGDTQTIHEADIYSLTGVCSNGGQITLLQTNQDMKRKQPIQSDFSNCPSKVVKVPRTCQHTPQTSRHCPKCGSWNCLVGALHLGFSCEEQRGRSNTGRRWKLPRAAIDFSTLTRLG